MLVDPSVLNVEEETDKAARPRSEFTKCKSGCPMMVVVPAGKFMMGSPATERDRSSGEGPQHELTIARPFEVGKTEVTFKQWDACVVAAKPPSLNLDECRPYEGRTRESALPAGWFRILADLPVNNPQGANRLRPACAYAFPCSAASL
jgi:formylglycine-generating enzyme required for sulfatase activity